MNDDQPRPDTGQMDMSAHDQGPDISLDTAMSIREAAAAADVTEKTIRRWIKAGRLHAVKLGGQYRITVADLDHARAEQQGPLAQQADLGRPGAGHDPPRVDMSIGLDTEQEDVQRSQSSGTVDLGPLVEHIAQLEVRVQQLTEAATIWQVRARQAEERLQQLTATVESTTETPGSPERAEIGEEAAPHQPDDSDAPEGIWARLVRFLRGGDRQ